ncbi:hypothetical protein BD410DRAFT_792146 [Rickenella mellea]|uniref:Uncharacterized protein n=1 Tax=Rickenella mellea TaxID=50990 RepID=A0A4Y7PGN4_9AGAM|nr:hypothetical protein BD410DRAFT_797250 [Rickenella mellea]TDL19519.1 hypothetical protein BD410DRAFT_792146 [Rickenella mellea]
MPLQRSSARPGSFSIVRGDRETRECTVGRRRLAQKQAPLATWVDAMGLSLVVFCRAML